MFRDLINPIQCRLAAACSSHLQGQQNLWSWGWALAVVTGRRNWDVSSSRWSQLSLRSVTLSIKTQFWSHLLSDLVLWDWILLVLNDYTLCESVSWQTYLYISAGDSVPLVGRLKCFHPASYGLYVCCLKMQQNFWYCTPYVASYTYSVNTRRVEESL